MRLMTLNTHSLIEENYSEKLDIFVKSVCRIKPDIIAMQEVNQTIDREIVKGAKNLIPSPKCIPIKRDNHALSACARLYINGLTYHFIWLGIKNGYGKFEEGVAVLSRKPIESVKTCTLSKADDFNDWKTRKALGVKVCDNWFYSIHTGRFDDKDEPFSKQWSKLNSFVSPQKNVWLMGDFNCPANKTDEGYDLILSSGWSDTYLMALKKDNGITVKGNIDGWRDTKSIETGCRIDYIFTNNPITVKSSHVVFDGKNYGIVSDHCAIVVDV